MGVRCSVTQLPVQTMELLGFQIRAPEVATVVRWLLRVVLVAFLAWLVKGRQEQEPEDEQVEEDEPDRWERQGAPRGGQLRNNYDRTAYRQNPRRRDEYPQRDVRQRRPVNSESVDFDAVINKMSKPKQMWEVTKTGKAPQILKRDNSTDFADSSPKEAGQRKDVGPPERIMKEPKRPKDEDRSKMLNGHSRPVTWITWNRDGNLLFTCGKDKKVCVWSFPDAECLGSYEGHSGAVWACSVTADSSWLVTGGADQNVIVWEARASRELSRIELPGVCRFVEWASSGSSDGGERFATVHNKFGKNPAALTVYRFDGEVIEQKLRIDGIPGSATQVRWGRDDNFLVSCHDNGELIFWRADTGTEVHRLQVHEAPISKIDFSADRLLVATASTDKKVKVWDLGEEGSDAKLIYEAETDRPLNAVAFGPLTRASVIGTGHDRPGCCAVIVGGGQDIRDVALTGGTSEEFNTLLFRVGATHLEADGSVKGHFGPVHTLACTADGSAMASGSEDGYVRLHMFSDTGSSK